MPPYEPSSDWQFDVPTSGSKRLPPAARSFESLAHQGYSFEAAIADLIDNSIDAGAHNVVVSFLRDTGSHGDRAASSASLSSMTVTAWMTRTWIQR
jgi:hypothetical protein